MTDAKRAEQVARDTILNLLSDEENAKVITAEAASRLAEGAEYLDLEHLDEAAVLRTALASTHVGALIDHAQNPPQNNLSLPSAGEPRTAQVDASPA